MDDIKSGSGKGLQGFVAVIVHVDLPVDSAETEMVGNHKGVHPVVLWQVRIGFLELPHLLGIQNMDFPLKPPQAAILTKSIDWAVPVDGGGFQANYYVDELHGMQCRYNLL